MHFYPHHIGDYQRKTPHLSIMEHGAYRLLMDAYYAAERPLPTQPDALHRICRAMTKAEREAVDIVSELFFTRTSDGFVHKRIDEELESYKKQCEANRKNGCKGGRPPKQKPIQNPLGFNSVSDGITETVTETKGNQEPITINPPNPLEPPASPSLGLEVESIPKPSLSPEQIEIGSWFGRRPTTAWSEKELKAWAKISKPLDPDDWQAIRWYYTQSGSSYLRRDIQTLLNNWNGEIDRAKNFDPELKCA